MELDIPLKSFRMFLSEEDGQIDYYGLLEHGKQNVQEKMQHILKRLEFLENMQREIHHAENCVQGQFTKAILPERLCWAIPYEGTQTDSAFHSAMYRLISEVERHGLHAGFNNGQLVQYQGTDIRSYLFIDLRETGDVLEQHDQILRIPGGEYLCTVSGESQTKNAHEVFLAVFHESSDRVVVEVELFSRQFHYAEPVFELRCKL